MKFDIFFFTKHFLFFCVDPLSMRDATPNYFVVFILYIHIHTCNVQPDLLEKVISIELHRTTCVFLHFDFSTCLRNRLDISVDCTGIRNSSFQQPHCWELELSAAKFRKFSNFQLMQTTVSPNEQSIESIFCLLTFSYNSF